MASNPRSEAVTAGYQRTLRGLAGRLAVVLGVAWDQMDSPTPEATEEWLRRVVPFVLAAQTSAVVLSDAYLSLYIRHETGRIAPPRALDASQVIGVRARGGTPLENVYARPVGFVSAAVGGGMALEEAKSAERWRLDRNAQTDVTLAAREARRQWGEDESVVGYRRVVTGGCALCASASDGIYQSDALMPIHPGCDCVTEPVLRDEGRNRPESPEVTDIPSRTDKAEEGKRVARVVTDPELGPLLEAIS